MNNKDLINEWMRKAENDLLNVENNLNSKSVPTDTVCFHCQQAVEKYLKAYCVKLDIVFIKSHDLFYLLDIINEKSNGSMDDEIYLQCEKLNDYSSQTRYPMDFYEPSIDEAQEAYQTAKQVKQFILKKIQ